MQMTPFIYTLTFIVSGYLLLSAVQGRPSFILLLPILLLTAALGWYLNRHIQIEHEETIRKGFAYAKDEVDADHWLHQSFVPKINILLKKHIKETILYSGVILLAFIFFWTYIVAGLVNALLSIGIAVLLYSLFIYYLLHVEKWYNFIFRRLPRSYKHLKKNDWVHAYVVLFPFAILCSLIYVVFNYPPTISIILLTIPISIVVYTLLFIFLYCGAIIYKEYKKSQDKERENTIKKMLEE